MIDKSKSKEKKILPEGYHGGTIYMENHFAVSAGNSPQHGMILKVHRFKVNGNVSSLGKEVASKRICGGCTTRVFGHRFTKRDVEYEIAKEKAIIKEHKRALAIWQERAKNTDWEDDKCTDGCLDVSNPQVT